MKMKTHDLQGAALDWAVAQANLSTGSLPDHGMRDAEDGYSPSTDWAQGGPIIEREQIDLQCFPKRIGSGFVWRTFYADGPTPLIAAMRCFVASKLGDEIEVPDELNQLKEQA